MSSLPTEWLHQSDLVLRISHVNVVARTDGEWMENNESSVSEWTVECVKSRGVAPIILGVEHISAELARVLIFSGNQNHVVVEMTDRVWLVALSSTGKLTAVDEAYKRATARENAANIRIGVLEAEVAELNRQSVMHSNMRGTLAKLKEKTPEEVQKRNEIAHAVLGGWIPKK